MKMSPVRLVSALLLLSLLCSCSGRPRIIPKRTMANIYADMFLLDQWLSGHREERNAADTSLFYDPIFERYGYTFEDYDASVKHYLKDPEKFAKVFKAASVKLKDGRDRFRDIMDNNEKVREYNARFKGLKPRDFKKDTLLWRRLADSLPLDSLARDSLIRDSLIRDSLIRDSLRLDSLRIDSLRLDSLRRDSLRRRSHGLNSRHRHIEASRRSVSVSDVQAVPK
ncbi:MAG: DUF4296 domain-containing protein [Bacteroidales bacterium]|nr:DUF4296 domain-containing protein [Bacteroidales bacterium]